MRLVMIGTGPFAVPTFRELLVTHHTIAALVTGPVRGKAGKRVPATPIRDLAHAHGVRVFDPEDINAPWARAELAAVDADLLVVCDYGQILSAETLATARLGGINLHASLLPKYRGAAPINWALYYGETETGVSVIHMTPEVDAGPVIAQGATPIYPHETAVELEARLAEFGAWFVRRAIDNLESGKLEAFPQDPALACKAPRLKKSDGLIDWTRPATAIRNQYRAMQPWPKTYTYWQPPKGLPLRLIVGPLGVEEGQGGALPGTVLEAHKGRLVVAAGQGAVIIQGVHPSGKRAMSVEEFLRGYPLRAGDRLIAAAETAS